MTIHKPSTSYVGSVYRDGWKVLIDPSASTADLTLGYNRTLPTNVFALGAGDAFELLLTGDTAVTAIQMRVAACVPVIPTPASAATQATSSGYFLTNLVAPASSTAGSATVGANFASDLGGSFASTDKVHTPGLATEHSSVSIYATEPGYLTCSGVRGATHIAVAITNIATGSKAGLLYRRLQGASQSI